MYIVAIAWMYVVLMMSITERSLIAGVMTFLLYGALPLIVILYLMGSPQRKRKRALAGKLETETPASRPSASATEQEPASVDSDQR